MAVKKRKASLSGNKKSSEVLERVQHLEQEMGQALQEMERAVKRVDCLSRFGSLVGSALEPSILVQEAEATACELLGCESARVYLTQLADHLPTDVSLTQDRFRSSILVPIKTPSVDLGQFRAYNKIPWISGRESSAGHGQSDFDETDQRLLADLSRQLALGLENFWLREKVKKSFSELVDVLAEAIEKKDHYTGGHTKRVAYYSTLIGKYLGLTAEQSEMVRMAAILHDVGKLGIEDRVLKKPAPLTEEEWLEMRMHPQLGFEIMSRVEGFPEAVSGAHDHHERWDGTGYPRGLKGEEIPLAARIVALADAYDALITNRPYRPGIDPLLAYDEILKNRGTQFDPRVVDAFTEAFQNEKMGKGSGGSNRG